MFTGLIEEIGEVVQIAPAPEGGARLVLRAPMVSRGARPGDSISVSGCCLSVEQVEGERLNFSAVPETLARTTLGRLRAGSQVNLERPVCAGGRMGGHFVQGHVDGVGRVESVAPEGQGCRMGIELPSGLTPYVAEKGSIAVDGVSLTVAALTAAGLEVTLIPQTLACTTLGALQEGDAVNLEVDVLAKYIERLLSRSAPVLR